MTPEMHIAATMHICGQCAFGAHFGIAAAVNLNRNIVGRNGAHVRIAAAVHLQGKARLPRESSFGLQVATAMHGNGGDGGRCYLNLKLLIVPTRIAAGRQHKFAVAGDFDLRNLGVSFDQYHALLVAVAQSCFSAAVKLDAAEWRDVNDLAGHRCGRCNGGNGKRGQNRFDHRGVLREALRERWGASSGSTIARGRNAAMRAAGRFPIAPRT